MTKETTDYGIDLYADEDEFKIVLATSGSQDLTLEQALHLVDALRDVTNHVRMLMPGKDYDHDPSPDSGPEPGEFCKVCGEDITWIGPGLYDYLHVDDKENR